MFWMNFIYKYVELNTDSYLGYISFCLKYHFYHQTQFMDVYF